MMAHRNRSQYTEPAGVAVSVTYDALPDEPVNAGSYQVIATITDPNYTGSVTDTLVISKAASTTTVTCEREPFVYTDRHRALYCNCDSSRGSTKL